MAEQDHGSVRVLGSAWASKEANVRGQAGTYALLAQRSEVKRAYAMQRLTVVDRGDRVLKNYYQAMPTAVGAENRVLKQGQDTASTRSAYGQHMRTAVDGMLARTAQGRHSTWSAHAHSC